MARRGRPPYPDVLTPREWEVLGLLRTGLSNPEIAERLGITRDGVKYHVSEILSKLGVSSRQEAGLLSIAEVRRPWWMAAFAPIGFVWRKTGQAIAVAVLAGVAFGLFALLVACSSTNDDPSGVHQLAYVDIYDRLMLYDADTEEKWKLADVPCRVDIEKLAWSPDGKKLACVSGPTLLLVNGETGGLLGQVNFQIPPGDPIVSEAYWAPGSESIAYERRGRGACGRACDDMVDMITVVDASGEQPQELRAEQGTSRSSAWASWGWPLWSPDGERIAYRTVDGETRIHTLNSGESEVLQGDHRPLGWALDGEAVMVAQGYEPPAEVLLLPSYEAKLFDLSGRELRAFPELDDGTQFWLSPDGSRAVYLIPNFALVEGGSVPGLGVLDLLSGESTPIEGSLITYGSEHIPQEWVTFSEDGKYVYWVGGDNAGYRAKMDGTDLQKVLELEETVRFSWSSDHERIVWFENTFAGSGRAIGDSLNVADGDGSNRRLVDQVRMGTDLPTALADVPRTPRSLAEQLLHQAPSVFFSWQDIAWRPVVPATSD